MQLKEYCIVQFLKNVLQMHIHSLTLESWVPSDSDACAGRYNSSYMYHVGEFLRILINF